MVFGVWSLPGWWHCPGGGQIGSQRPHLNKKLDEAGESDETDKDAPAIDLDTIILAGVERGLTISDIRMMTIGQLVDYVISYNQRQKMAEKEAKKQENKENRRKATQQDIDAFFG